MPLLQRGTVLSVLFFSAQLPLQGQAPTPAKPRPASQTSRQIVHRFQQVSISPDGRSLAWVGPYVTPGSGRDAPTALYVSDLRVPAAQPRRVTAGNGRGFFGEYGAAWSPDGKSLAFLSDAPTGKQHQVYVTRPWGDGRASRLTNLTGAISTLRWSPDGREIGFLFIENAPRQAGPTASVPPQTGEIVETTFEQRLCTVTVGTGEMRMITPTDVYVYEFAWSPDARQFAAIAAHGSGDNNWYIAELYKVSAATGAMRSILKTPMQIAMPCWSPDGQSVAFIGGLMSDEGVIGGDIFTISSQGGKERNLTPGIASSPCWLTWLSSGRILFTDHVDGGTGIASLDPTGGELKRIWSAGVSIAGESWNAISVARDGVQSALVRQSFHQPPAIWTGPLGEWKPLTHANDGVTPRWGKAHSLHWKSGEFTVQGWLLYPMDYQKDKRYPMVVVVHGGPASQLQPSFPSRFFDMSELSSKGYFVFMPNPRGSYGQGEKFTRANVKDFGHGDLRDILAGVDEVLRTAPVDPHRLGLTGWSYGGYMTMWAVTQTNRFQAAVAGAGIANWQSYYGQNGIDQWMIPYFGASVYDDPAVYAKSSPINFIKQVKTPTLVLVGEYDVECPAPQSYEFWHALKTLGVPTELVVYPKEGHGIAKPDHQRDIMRRLTAWFDKRLE